MEMKITLLTVGEYPSIASLHASQLLSFGEYLSKKYAVEWVAFVPVEMALKDVFLSIGKLKKIEELALSSGVKMHIKYFPLTISLPHSYIARDLLVHLAGIRLIKFFNSKGVLLENHIIHCRSYFAAAVALEVKKKIPCIKVSFDMRSFLPPEIPMMFPKIGRYLYGGLKCWEYYLLEKCDFSFMTTRRGINLLELEGSHKPPSFIPIIGFENDHLEEVKLTSLDTPVVGYVGSFSTWQSPIVLNVVFDKLVSVLPQCSFAVITEDYFEVPNEKNITVMSASNSEVKKILSTMLALVVPGPLITNNYFSELKMSANFFSTKAAEALSLGVPLIVNAKLIELASFVRANKCGLVFDLIKENVYFHGGDDSYLRKIESWENMRLNALKCAGNFSRTYVFEEYLKVWAR